MVSNHVPNALKNRKWFDLANLGIGVACLVLVNLVGSFFFGRIDLTEEKRHTLSETTRDDLRSLEDIVYVRVYLEGNLPNEFRELRDATREMLDEFRAFAGANVQYSFINPAESPNEEERIEVYKELTRQGLQYTNMRVQKGDQMSEQIIFPGAILSYQGREVPVQLLKSQIGATQGEMLAASTQQLEYEFMSALKKVHSSEKLHVAIIDGHSELDTLETADTEMALSEFYQVDRVVINGQLNALKGYRAAIIAQPDSAFSEKDKFVLDQFIMNGGRVLWMIDPVFARMDSLRHTNLSMALVLNHNLDDQLFRYGARLNPDLILDLEAAPLPIVTGMIGNQPKQEMFTWFYAPLAQGNEESPITRNLDRVLCEFASTIDSIEVEGIRHTPLLRSSERCRLQKAPTRISFNVLREKPRYEQFSTGPHTVAMLLEGEFPSVFTNRLPKRILENDTMDFKERSVPNKMIVVSDADIMRNPVSRTENKYFTLGYYKYTNLVYGNREFILNAMNFLCDDSGLMNVRAKEFKIRLLDQARVDEERYYWQVFNIGLPLTFIALMGLGMNWWRKRKFAEGKKT